MMKVRVVFKDGGSETFEGVHKIDGYGPADPGIELFYSKPCPECGQIMEKQRTVYDVWRVTVKEM